MRALLFLVVVTGCPGPDKPKPPVGPTCESILPKLTEAYVANVERHGAGPGVLAQARAEAKAVEADLARACADDRWSADLIRCVDTSPPADVGSCQHLLTPAQLDNIHRIREAGGTAGSHAPPPP